MRRLWCTLLIVVGALNAHAGVPTVWSHEFQVHKRPYVASIGPNQLAIRGDGYAVFAGAGRFRAEPVEHDLVILGPGPQGSGATRLESGLIAVKKVQALGNRTFTLLETANFPCLVVENGIMSPIWQQDTGLGRCASMDVTPDGIFVVDSRGVWTRIGLPEAATTSEFGVRAPPGTHPATDVHTSHAIIRALPGGDVLIAAMAVALPRPQISLSRRRSNGEVLWTRSISVDYGAVHDIDVQPDGRYTFVFFANIHATHQTWIWRGETDGSAATTQSALSDLQEQRQTCLVGYEARIVSQFGSPMTLVRYPMGEVPITTELPELASYYGNQVACRGGRTYVTGKSIATGRLAVGEVGPLGVIWLHELPAIDPEQVALQASENVIFVAYMAEDLVTGGKWRLQRYNVNGLLLSTSELEYRAIDSVPYDLIGSHTGNPVLVSHEDAGLHLLSIDAGSGPWWGFPLRANFAATEPVDDFYDIRRLDNGGVDFVGGMGEFVRLNPNGTQTSAIPVGDPDTSTASLHYRSNGDVIVKGAEDPGDVYLVRGNQTIATTSAHLGAIVGTDNRVYILKRESLLGGPSAVLYELDGAFQPIAGSRSIRGFAVGDWIMHPQGAIDHITERTFSRTSRTGGPGFNTPVPSEVPGQNIRSVATERGGIASIVRGPPGSDDFDIVRVDETGIVRWVLPVPFEPTSFVMDADGSVGFAGASGHRTFASLVDINGRFRLNETCDDDRLCEQAVSAIGAEDGRWFVAGTRPALTSDGAALSTFVAEIDPPGFKSGFEADEVDQ